MPLHVIVDGSNLATEGRSMPSLKQLNEAVMAYIAEHPTALITVVADATFGHRIDKTEVEEFDAAVANNEIVCPPAGAIGRGDAFVLSIANKVGASILSNDSYQEFHGQYPWLFDEGRLVGGKPVPHVGWVFVNRTPVRGVTSRKAVADAKRKTGKAQGAAVKAGNRPSAAASQPMPVPTSPPPGRAPQRSAAKAAPAAAAPAAAAAAAAPDPALQVAGAAETSHRQSAVPAGVNDLMSFLTFVGQHPVGSPVTGVVDHYSSHGAYLRIGEIVGYVPLRLMADPAPRSARELMKVGETVHLVVESYSPGRRSLDLAVPAMSSVAPPAAPARRKRRPASEAAVGQPADPAPVDTAPVETAAVEAATPGPTGAARRRTRRPSEAVPDAPAAAPAAEPASSAGRRPSKRTPATNDQAASPGAESAPGAGSAPGVEPAPGSSGGARRKSTRATAASTAGALPTTGAAAAAPAATAKPSERRATAPGATAAVPEPIKAPARGARRTGAGTAHPPSADAAARPDVAASAAPTAARPARRAKAAPATTTPAAQPRPARSARPAAAAQPAGAATPAAAARPAKAATPAAASRVIKAAAEPKAPAGPEAVAEPKAAGAGRSARTARPAAAGGSSKSAASGLTAGRTASGGSPAPARRSGGTRKPAASAAPDPS